jgi:hypothetical protein
MAVIVVNGFVGTEIVPPAGPEIFVQVPVPTTAVLPAIVVVAAQIVWSGPAAATVGAAFIVIVTSSADEVHGALAIVQRITTEAPAIPVNVEVGELALVIVAVPETTDQVPVPITAVLPARVVVVPQIVWSVPALAVVGAGLTVKVMSSVVGVQIPLETVHLNTTEGPAIPVTLEVAREGVVTVAVPETTDHTPVPIAGAVAARVVVVAHIV